MDTTTLIDLFAANPDRGSQYSASACGLYFDYSKDHLTEQTLDYLFKLADAAQLKPAIQKMFNGELVNNTEGRAALHVALRGGGGGGGGGVSAASKAGQKANQHLKKVVQFATQIRQGQIKSSTAKPFRNIVNLGIGGSDLGPRLVVSAFPEHYHTTLQTHFVANIDSDALTATLKQCTPDTTLFIVSSKSFSTLETLNNADRANTWLRQAGIEGQLLDRHFVGITGHRDAATQWGIAQDRIFTVEDWVGGRFSLWSSIGLPIAIALGTEPFQQLLEGAREMDEHFRYTPFEANLPVLHGLQAIWHINFRNYKSRAVLPYVHRLGQLPAYLQQLMMESLGKTTTKEGAAVDFSTGQIIWGSEGTNGQHSFHQLLLQGTDRQSIEFIATRSAHCEAGSHRHLNSHCLAQSRALMEGKSQALAYEELLAEGASPDEADRLAAHKSVPGNRPSNTLLLDDLTPRCLGALLAFYEHSVYVQSVIWNINAFDQWGVELGKEMGNELFLLLNKTETMSVAHEQMDSSTRSLLGCLHNSIDGPRES